MEFSFIACKFIIVIYESRQDKLMANNKDRTFQQYIFSQFNKNNISTLKTTKSKQADISRILLPIPFRPNKSNLVKSKYYKRIQFSKLKILLFTQATKCDIENILKIKDVSSRLSSNKIIKIHNIVNNDEMKSKLKLNVTTKGPSRKQIIISMRKNNSNIIVSQVNIHISNINRLLKGVKSEILADFIYFNNRKFIITTNKLAATSDLNVIKKYIKKLNNINSNNIMSF